ncbi:MAG: ATP-dependent DNA helicase RecG [Anaerolineales bacterium]
MKPSIEKLHKFLKLEVKNGYNNRAVIGGLQKVIITWENEARADNLPESLIRAVHARLRDYHQLTINSRAETLEGLWKRVQRGSDEPLPGLTEEEKRAARPPPRRAKPASRKPPPREAKKTEEKTATRPDGETVKRRKPTPKAILAPPVPEGEAAALNAPLTVLSGVGPGYANSMARLGMKNLSDALYYFPRRYDDYSQLKPINRLWYGEEVTIIGTVEQVNVRPTRSGRVKLVEAVVSDGSGALRVTWFNQPWLVSKLRDKHIVLSGKIDQYLGRLVMSSPEWELLEKKNLHTNRIVPVYPLTARITQRWLRKTLDQVISYWAPRLRDPLPENLRQSAELLPLSTALLQVHYPDSWEMLEAARHRLAFDEVLLLQLGVMRQRRLWTARTARVFNIPPDWLKSQFARLPYTLTGAQQRAINDIRIDLASGHPMNRLLQGDVGAGKTVVAAMGIAMVTRRGPQAALMAPTSILAEQHYKSLKELLAAKRVPLRPEQIRLMVGATPESEKAKIRAGLQSGEIKLVVGTHALIEAPVIFDDLQLVIIDEQHRFGVKQRAALREKGDNPHLLVMTATPIPRSLALTVYGDLDLSVMDEMPPGRQEISTHILYPLERERAYTLIKREVENGRQAFIIYPLVEESEKSEAKAAVEEHARLQKGVFPKLSLGLLHGRLKPDEKEAAMTHFRDGEHHILVSTSVVEVGVDVPNATVMLIEGANHFGLAQLHQFRGRVGRGKSKSYCLLIPNTDDAVENERLSAIAETSDGFVLAERDLEQRGPGEFLGTRQSGYSELKMASLTDVQLIEKARRHAQMLFKADPELKEPEHQLLALAVDRFWGGESDQ